ncbi:hypothetical protein Rs2_42824 [Raphanus sativus]|nr:hypothetical protein Rs2_42824 [Raphanus sativus]
MLFDKRKTILKALAIPIFFPQKCYLIRENTILKGVNGRLKGLVTYGGVIAEVFVGLDNRSVRLGLVSGMASLWDEIPFNVGDALRRRKPGRGRRWIRRLWMRVWDWPVDALHLERAPVSMCGRGGFDSGETRRNSSCSVCSDVGLGRWVATW